MEDMRQAPTDWLSIHASKLPKSEDERPPRVFQFFDEFCAEVENLRCRQACDAHSQAEQVGCICTLAERLADLSGPWMSKSEFAQVLAPVGYDWQQALRKYELYAERKLWKEAGPELERLHAEAENAYNLKVGSRDPQLRKAFHAASKAAWDRSDRVLSDLEKIMSKSD